MKKNSSIRLITPRSSARSFHHALIVALKSRLAASGA
jgi:hypothetical protein